MDGPQHLQSYIRTLIELKHHYAYEDEEMFKMYAKVTDEAADLIYKHITQITDQKSVKSV